MNNSESIRRHVAALQPVDMATLELATGMKRGTLWDYVGGMLRREHLVKDADGKLCTGRHIVAKVKGQGRFSRLNRDSYSKRAVNAEIAKAMHNKAIGFPGGAAQGPSGAPTVEDFIAKGGKVQMLARGEVSAASRLVKIGAAA